MTPTKACPVVLRQREVLEILAFEHPLAGFQLVKGTVETDELPLAAALRELYEEAGISEATFEQSLGVAKSNHQGQVWSFHVCKPHDDLPDTWIHRVSDDGGHDFRFFWQPLYDEPCEGWHKVFRWALGYIRDKISLG